VCDEVRDIEAAKKSGIKSIAVAWGYNTKDALIKENPDFLVNSPDELINIIVS
jgi:phosphoglycolate phosphatase-like HAD superfamily hydrolase